MCCLRFIVTHGGRHFQIHPLIKLLDFSSNSRKNSRSGIFGACMDPQKIVCSPLPPLYTTSCFDSDSIFNAALHYVLDMEGIFFSLFYLSGEKEITTAPLVEGRTYF
ncbi:hypothetical protein CEXT_527081 [Caerostris extrusa]|uniref:Uncharacterized protein n=1 Tax=Caerostris extrusa TaxID=172846 RepID=A0AAV4XHI0_CAEEX|nr:hypothetical protein CEXT_527081 [Caerostris extrusa]